MRHSHTLSLLAGAAALILVPAAALAADAKGEIVTAETHAGLASTAADIAGVHMHLHHAVNCLEGPTGKDYDAKQMNPCANSGAGAIPDTMDAATKTKLAAAVAKAESGIAASDIVVAKQDATATSEMLKAIK